MLFCSCLFASRYAQELYQEHNLVCPTSVGTPINPSNLRRSLYRIIKKASVTRVTFHELRHSHLTHLLMAGVDSKIAASRGRHSSTRVTNDIYRHVIKGVQRDALTKYREIIPTKK
ncbi:tyrosine-type recombinase/integrase [Paenibacillus sp. PvR148]